MTIQLNGTSGITTPKVDSTGGVGSTPVFYVLVRGA